MFVCLVDLDICFLVLLLPILPGFSLKKHGSSQEGFCQIQRAFGAPYPPRLVGMMSETGSWGGKPFPWLSHFDFVLALVFGEDFNFDFLNEHELIFSF